MKKNVSNQHSHTYQTGSTNPPKSRQGLIAVLLILVIFLAGAVSALSLMNVHLFRMLEEQNNNSLMFSNENAVAMAAEVPNAVALEESGGVDSSALGLAGQEFTSLYRSYQDWPQGIYISFVDPEGPAAKANIQVGDILISMNGMEIPDRAAFETAISKLTPGNPLVITLFREGQELSVSITLK